MAGKAKTRADSPEPVTVTINGLDLTIRVDQLDDVDVLYELKDANDGDIFAALNFIDLMLGEEQRKALVDTVRDPETGRASVGDLTKLLEQLFESLPKS